MITARQGTEKDIDRIVEIYNTLHPNTFSPAYVLDRVSRKDCVVAVVCEDDKVMGFGFLEMCVPDPYLVTHFILDPTWKPAEQTAKATALKAMATVWLKYVVRPPGTTVRRTLPPGSGALIRATIHTIMPFVMVGYDQNGYEIWRAEFPEKMRQKMLAANLSLLKE